MRPRAAARAGRALALCAAVVAGAGCASGGAPERTRDGPPELVPVTEVREDASPRVLCVVAHPDDEIAFAGALYKTSALLGGACDVFTITNGEGGYRYSTLAERVYGLKLTDEAVGRRELPEIRKRELAAGCRWLGVRDIHFLREKDHRYTQDLREVLGPETPWDLARVARELDRRLAAGAYDFVLVHLPTLGTHAHHLAATVLALEAVRRVPEERRPVALGARVVTGNEPATPFVAPGAGTFGREEPRLADPAAAPLVFDRREKFGHLDRLDWGIVVSWAVAEHRSQGTMQLLAHRGDREEYLLLDTATPGAAARAAAWFDRLRTTAGAVPPFRSSTLPRISLRRDPHDPPPRRPRAATGVVPRFRASALPRFRACTIPRLLPQGGRRDPHRHSRRAARTIVRAAPTMAEARKRGSAARPQPRA